MVDRLALFHSTGKCFIELEKIRSVRYVESKCHDSCNSLCPKEISA